MKSWPALENRLSAVIDRQFAEPFLFVPYTARPNQRVVIDPDRAEQQVLIVFDDKHDSLSGKAVHARSTSLPFVDLELSRFLGGIQKKDRLQRASTGDWYDIVDVRPDGQGRAKCDLVKIANG